MFFISYLIQGHLAVLQMLYFRGVRSRPRTWALALCLRWWNKRLYGGGENERNLIFFSQMLCFGHCLLLAIPTPLA